MKKIVLMCAAVAAVMTVTQVSAKDNGGRERPAFSAIDADGNGQVTTAEMQAYRTTKMAERFAAADANNDGSLSQEEMAAMGRANASDRAAKRAERMIERLDANDNGTLELDEMKGRGDREGRGFGRADKDNDGTLSEAEYNDMRKRGGGRK